MASVLGLLVLLLATLTLGGCAGLPYGAMGDSGAYGGYSAGYGGAVYPQGYPSAAAIPVPVPVDPGYVGGYAPQIQPYYVPAPQPYYAPGPSPDVAEAPFSPERRHHQAAPWIDHRERDQAARIRQGRRDGSLTPHEAQRLWAEQRRIRGAEGRMMSDGNLSPHERARLNTMQNRASQDIYRGRHNGMVQPGAPGFQHGNGPVGPTGSMLRRGAPGPQAGNGPIGSMHPTVRSGGPGPQSGNGPVVGSMGQHQNAGGQVRGSMPTQARPTQSGGAPRGSIIPIPSQ